MAEAGRSRIRLRLPTGAEIETEGDPEFVRLESQRLLGVLSQSAQGPAKTPETAAGAVWQQLTEQQKEGLILRIKPGSGSLEEACLILLGAARALMGLEKPTATQLARWLRQSSCPFKRLDRILHEAVRRGDILAYGYRRSRRYELTAAGTAKAALLAHRLLP